MSKFLKEHKKNLRKLTKKQLIQQVINHIEITANIETKFNDSYEDLFQESLRYKRELEQTEGFLKSAESALIWKDNLSILGFIRNKYFR